jgi:hypothetical protein
LSVLTDIPPFTTALQCGVVPSASNTSSWHYMAQPVVDSSHHRFQVHHSHVVVTQHRLTRALSLACSSPLSPPLASRNHGEKKKSNTNPSNRRDPDLPISRFVRTKIRQISSNLTYFLQVRLPLFIAPSCLRASIYPTFRYDLEPLV